MCQRFSCAIHILSKSLKSSMWNSAKICVFFDGLKSHYKLCIDLNFHIFISTTILKHSNVTPKIVIGICSKLAKEKNNNDAATCSSFI